MDELETCPCSKAHSIGAELFLKYSFTTFVKAKPYNISFLQFLIVLNFILCSIVVHHFAARGPGKLSSKFEDNYFRF